MERIRIMYKKVIAEADMGVVLPSCSEAPSL